MIGKHELDKIGSVTKTHGVHGELSAVVDVDVNLSDLKCVVFDIDGIFVPFFIGSERPRGASGCLFMLNGVDDEMHAAAFVGKQIYALRRDLDRLGVNESDGDDDVFYLEDAVGYTLYDTDGSRIGIISRFDDSTPNYLYGVDRESAGEILVPAAEDMITDIDIDREIITMNLPKGLY